MIENSTIKLLWTGGWDSTFRLCDLLINHKKIVQPHYIIDTNRKSLRFELKAQESIIAELKIKFPEVKHLLLPHKFSLVSDLKENKEISKSYNEFIKKYKLGTQFEWLSRYCFDNEISNLELGWEKNPPEIELSREYMIIRENLIETISNSMITYKFKNSDSTSIESTLFKYFEFPLIETTRIMMSDVAKKSDFYDIMHLTWFCHNPKNGKPCGLCNPCKDIIKFNFQYRLPKSSKIRYHLRYFTKGELIRSHPNTYKIIKKLI